MVIIINLDGEEVEATENAEEVEEEKSKKFLPEFHHFPQLQVIPVTDL